MSELTHILAAVEKGDRFAAEQLLPLVYDELRKLAAYYLRQERSDHTLQATALVHEAYLRLVDQRHVDWKNRNHFFGVAAQLMRRVLLMHARQHHAAKRGGGAQRVPFEETAVFSPAQAEELIFIDELLIRLALMDPQQTRIVELRFFAGLTLHQAAEALGVSVATADNDWAYAKGWLKAAIAEHSAAD